MASLNPLQSFNLGKNTTPVLVVLLVIAAFLIGSLLTKVSYLEKGTVSPSALGTTPNQAAAPTPVPGQKVDVGVGTLPLLGNKNAKVTIVEFSDLQCPFCKRFFDDALPQIKKEYIDTGKVKLVYRDFPLGIHEMAQTYAEAAECAHEQGKFWEMHDKIFGEQKNGVATVDDLKKWARGFGVKEDQFNTCIDTKKYAEEVAKDLKDGEAAGVQGTPSFFINGKLVVGAVPFSVLEKEIEAALKK